MSALSLGHRVWLRVVVYGSILAALAGGLSFMIRMPGRSHAGPLPPLTDTQRQLAHRLRAHVARLAGDIGERNVWAFDGLEAAAAYLEATLRGLGYAVTSQEFTAQGRRVRNLAAERRGAVSADEIVLVGAHYDSVFGCPGANDNASGVAALLDLARWFAEQQPSRTLRFVAFVNEEPPLFQTGAMGSLVYARRARQRGDRIVAMLSLETIGSYSDVEGSQQYPFPFGLFYPSRSDFIAFVGNLASRALVREAVGSFRRHAEFPSEGVAAPGGIVGIGWSDHWSFWEQKYPALMVTDTALFRYAHYHLPSDTPERVDYERMARVVNGLARVIEDLTNP